MMTDTMFPLPCVCLTCKHFTVCEHRDKTIELYNMVMDTHYLALSNIVCTYYDYSPEIQYSSMGITEKRL